jgi:aminomethyltransferase
MVDFAGWSMPVQYTSIVEEHNATRRAIGLFDVSHMGRFTLTGPGTAEFLDRITTRRVADMSEGQIRYSLVTNEEGGILDDVLTYRIAGVADSDFQMVVNAGNREKIFDWLVAKQKDLGAGGVDIVDRTVETAMIAVQGPSAVALVEPLVATDLEGMRYYTGQMTNISGLKGLVTRTGYTGEDGCELIVAAEDAVAVWDILLGAGQSLGATPAGLACRDTLRLEAAMPLYGHELTEQINPIQAGLKFAINLKDRDFVGHDAIAGFKDDPAQPRRVGLVLSGRRVPREGYPIVDAAGKTVGHVTSGTFSPTLEQPIAMGYVDPQAAETGTELAIDIRGRAEPATVVALPFYKRAK